MSPSVQAVRAALVVELGAETQRRDVWAAGNQLIARHHSQGRIDGIAWCLQVLGYLEAAELGD
jgi:hypothetical protein